MKFLPAGCEACNILVGSIPDLEMPVCIFLRLSKAFIAPGLCEVDIPTRFVFLYLSNKVDDTYYQVGRTFSTAMSDDVFKEVAYKACHKGEMVAGFDEFCQKGYWQVFGDI